METDEDAGVSRRGLVEIPDGDAVYRRAGAMIDGCERVLLASLFPATLAPLRGRLVAAAARGIDVTVKLYVLDHLDGIETIQSAQGVRLLAELPMQELALATDGRQSLRAGFDREGARLLRAAWTDDTWLALNEFNALACELALTSVFGGLRRGEGPDALTARVMRLRNPLDTPGCRDLFDCWAPPT